MSDLETLIWKLAYYVLFGGFCLMWYKIQRLTDLLDDALYEIGAMEKDLDYQCERMNEVIGSCPRLASGEVEEEEEDE